MNKSKRKGVENAKRYVPQVIRTRRINLEMKKKKKCLAFKQRHPHSRAAIYLMYVENVVCLSGVMSSST